MFWVWVCLGLELINVGISMVVGVFVGRFLGVGVVFLGELEVAQRVDFVGLVVVGRGCVAYPNFFLEIPSNFGNHPHFSA